MNTIKKAKMIQVPLSRRELKEYIEGLVDWIQNDCGRVGVDARPADVPRLWRKARRYYIADQLKCAKRLGNRVDKAFLTGNLEAYDRAAATIERLCPLLGSAKAGGLSADVEAGIAAVTRETGQKRPAVIHDAVATFLGAHKTAAAVRAAVANPA